MRDWGKIERTEGEKEEKNFFLKRTEEPGRRERACGGEREWGGGQEN